MNRKYTKNQYLELVEKIRKAMPDISLTTDIIVGFPGETEEDFLETVDVVKKCAMTVLLLYLFKRKWYSGCSYGKSDIRRCGKRPFDRLLSRVQRLEEPYTNKYAGTVQEVLVEGTETARTHI